MTNRESHLLPFFRHLSRIFAKLPLLIFFEQILLKTTRHHFKQTLDTKKAATPLAPRPINKFKDTLNCHLAHLNPITICICVASEGSDSVTVRAKSFQ